ncbi:hypothetical protein LCGC14_1446880, partial [marine sediment metagenome]
DETTNILIDSCSDYTDSLGSISCLWKGSFQSKEYELRSIAWDSWWGTDFTLTDLWDLDNWNGDVESTTNNYVQIEMISGNPRFGDPLNPWDLSDVDYIYSEIYFNSSPTYRHYLHSDAQSMYYVDMSITVNTWSIFIAELSDYTALNSPDITAIDYWGGQWSSSPLLHRFRDIHFIKAQKYYFTPQVVSYSDYAGRELNDAWNWTTPYIVVGNNEFAEYFFDELSDSVDFTEGDQEGFTNSGSTTTVSNGLMKITKTTTTSYIQTYRTGLNIEGRIYTNLRIRIRSLLSAPSVIRLTEINYAESGKCTQSYGSGGLIELTSTLTEFNFNLTANCLNWLESKDDSNIVRNIDALRLTFYHGDGSTTSNYPISDSYEIDYIGLTGVYDYATLELLDSWDFQDSNEYFYNTYGNVSDFNDGSLETFDGINTTLSNNGSDYLQLTNDGDIEYFCAIKLDCADFSEGDHEGGFSGSYSVQDGYYSQYSTAWQWAFAYTVSGGQLEVDDRDINVGLFSRFEIRMKANVTGTNHLIYVRSFSRSSSLNNGFIYENIVITSTDWFTYVVEVEDFDAEYNWDNTGTWSGFDIAVDQAGIRTDIDYIKVFFEYDYASHGSISDSWDFNDGIDYFTEDESLTQNFDFDYAIVELDDEWDFNEDKDGMTHFYGGTSTWIGTTVNRTDTNNFFDLKFTGLNIDTSTYQYLSMGYYVGLNEITAISVVNTTESSVCSDSTNRAVGSWYIFTCDLSTSTNWIDEPQTILNIFIETVGVSDSWVLIDWIHLTPNYGWDLDNYGDLSYEYSEYLKLVSDVAEYFKNTLGNESTFNDGTTEDWTDEFISNYFYNVLSNEADFKDGTVESFIDEFLNEFFRDSLSNKSDFKDGTNEGFDCVSFACTSNLANEYLEFMNDKLDYFTEIYSDRIDFKEDIEGFTGLMGQPVSWESAEYLKTVTSTGFASPNSYSIDSNIYTTLRMRFNSSNAVNIIYVFDYIYTGVIYNEPCTDYTGWSSGMWHEFECVLSYPDGWNSSAETRFSVLFSGPISTKFIDYFEIVDPTDSVNITRTGLSINSDTYETFRIKFNNSQTVDTIKIFDSASNTICTDSTGWSSGSSFKIFSCDLGLSGSWSGTETEISFWFNGTTSGTIIIDWIDLWRKATITNAVSEYAQFTSEGIKRTGLSIDSSTYEYLQFSFNSSTSVTSIQIYDVLYPDGYSTSATTSGNVHLRGDSIIKGVWQNYCHMIYRGTDHQNNFNHHFYIRGDYIGWEKSGYWWNSNHTSAGGWDVAPSNGISIATFMGGNTNDYNSPWDQHMDLDDLFVGIPVIDDGVAVWEGQYDFVSDEPDDRWEIPLPP